MIVPIWIVLYTMVCSRVVLKRVLYYVGDAKLDTNLENYSYSYTIIYPKALFQLL